MSKLVLSIGVSLDGLVARPGRLGRLALVEVQTYATGGALHIYRPVRD